MYRVYDLDYRGYCPKESVEQVTFFNWIRSKYPDTYGSLAFHVRNEGKRTAAQVQREKMEGMTTGVSDIIIPGEITFVCELKRANKSKTKLPKAEHDFLLLADELGAFACLCYGHEQAIEAFEDWRSLCCS